MNEHVSIANRDRKRKRFVRETGKEDQKKKIRTDGGQVISNKKNRKNLYPSNNICLCFPLTIFLCTLKLWCRLTTSQLRGVEEKVQG